MTELFLDFEDQKLQSQQISNATNEDGVLIQKFRFFLCNFSENNTEFCIPT